MALTYLNCCTQPVDSSLIWAKYLTRSTSFVPRNWCQCCLASLLPHHIIIIIIMKVLSTSRQFYLNGTFSISWWRIRCLRRLWLWAKTHDQEVGGLTPDDFEWWILYYLNKGRTFVLIFNCGKNIFNVVWNEQTWMKKRKGMIPVLRKGKPMYSVWPDWATFRTLDNFSKPLAKIICPNLPHS